MGIMEKLKPDAGPTTAPCGCIQTPGRVRPRAPSTARVGAGVASAIPTTRILVLPSTDVESLRLGDSSEQRAPYFLRALLAARILCATAHPTDIPHCQCGWKDSNAIRRLSRRLRYWTRAVRAAALRKG